MKVALRCFGFAILALVLSAQCAFSEDSPMERCSMMCDHDKKMSKMGMDDMFMRKVHFIMANADEIGLSEDQMNRIETLKMDVKKSGIKNKADIDVLAIDIKSELTKDDVNLNTVNTLIDKKYLIKAQIAKDSAAACVNLKKILTAEQQKKMKDLWMAGMKGKKCHMQMMEGKE
jgi:Spy/CpxP family protein refolding chaperone